MDKYDGSKLENQLCFPLYAKKGYVKRLRSIDDERLLLVKITGEGEALKEIAAEIPAKVAECVKLNPDEAMNLYKTLYKILDGDKS